ncbi:MULTISPECIES: hypothetical protein [unclassified Streptomyces]|uniref:hypothetical protein n=1 Tax=unclassified Streptomyces TaxID=2593676 RepID=UPI00352D71A4
MPSEAELAGQYKTSMPTVRNALEVLQLAPPLGAPGRAPRAPGDVMGCGWVIEVRQPEAMDRTNVHFLLRRGR